MSYNTCNECGRMVSGYQKLCSDCDGTNDAIEAKAKAEAIDRFNKVLQFGNRAQRRAALNKAKEATK